MEMFNISIHAPVKGATSVGVFRWTQVLYFNPRTREGCDSGKARMIYMPKEISIHAPVKGATP